MATNSTTDAQEQASDASAPDAAAAAPATTSKPTQAADNKAKVSNEKSSEAAEKRAAEAEARAEAAEKTASDALAAVEKLTATVSELQDSVKAPQPAAAAEDLDAQSKAAFDKRMEEIDADPNLDDKDKKILKLYEQGVQQFEIARQVFEFVTQQSVAHVAFVINRAYAPDDEKVKDVNATKGYTGV